MDAAGGRPHQALAILTFGAVALVGCGPQTLTNTVSDDGTSSGSGAVAATGYTNGGGPAGPTAAAASNSSGTTSSAATGPSAVAASTGGTGRTTAATTSSGNGGSSGTTGHSATTSGASGAATTSGAAATGTTGGSTSSTSGSSSGGPTAAGIWIFRFDYLGYSSWDAVAAAVASQGAGYVLIKGSDGSDPETMTLSDGGLAPQLTEATVQSFTSLGIQVYAWSYVYPDDSDANGLAVISSYAGLPGVSGLVLDAEVEFEDDSTAAADSTALCTGLRNALPTGTFVGYTSFGIPSDHPDFPYSAFDAYCGDGFFPQLYWSAFSAPLDTWQGAEAQCLADVANLGLVAPLWPIGCNYEQDSSGDVTTPVPTADLNAFLADAGPTASLWEYPESNWPNLSTFVDQLSTLDW